jgi:RNA polymerase sigma factor (sigma-70 family)
MHVNPRTRAERRWVMTHGTAAIQRVLFRRMGGKPDVAETIRSFVDGEYPRVVAAVGFATGQPEAAEDAVQEALLKVLSDGHRPDRLGAWVTVVAINGVRGTQRRAKAERRAAERLPAPGTSDSTATTADRVTILGAVDALPAGQRTAVLLHYYLDSSVADIAAAMGVSEGTVKTHLHRGRAALAEALGDRS